MLKSDYLATIAIDECSDDGRSFYAALFFRAAVLIRFEPASKQTPAGLTQQGLDADG